MRNCSTSRMFSLADRLYQFGWKNSIATPQTAINAPTAARGLTCSLCIQIKKGRISTGASEQSVCATPTGAWSAATSDIQTPRNGPTTAPDTVKSHPSLREPMYEDAVLVIRRLRSRARCHKRIGAMPNPAKAILTSVAARGFMC